MLVSKTDGSKRADYILAYYCRILQLSSNGLILLQNKASPGADIILRSLLECFVNYKNLLADENFHSVLEMEWHSHKKRFYSDIESNPYLSSVSKAPDLIETLSIHQAEFDRLRSLGTKKANWEKRFEKIEWGDEYRAIYRGLSKTSHSILISVLSDHIVNPESGFDHFRIDSWDPDKHFAGVSAYISILVGSADDLRGYFKLPSSDDGIKIKSRISSHTAVQ